MKTSTNKENATETYRKKLIAHLRELVAALDRRVPHLEREGEQRIAHDSAALREKAQRRIAQLEKEGPR